MGLMSGPLWPPGTEVESTSVSRFEFKVYIVYMRLDQRRFAKNIRVSYNFSNACVLPYRVPQDAMRFRCQGAHQMTKAYDGNIGTWTACCSVVCLPSFGKCLVGDVERPRVSQGHMQAKQVKLVKRYAKRLLHFWSIARRSSLLQA